jgi:hypothetical protein
MVVVPEGDKSDPRKRVGHADNGGDDVVVWELPGRYK